MAKGGKKQPGTVGRRGKSIDVEISRDARHHPAFIYHANPHPTGGVIFGSDDDNGALREAGPSANGMELRARYDGAESSTDRGGRAVIIEGYAHKYALQDVVW